MATTKRLMTRVYRPPTFTQHIVLSDGSTYVRRTTSPRASIRLTKDIRNAALWNPDAGKQVGREEGGRLARFNDRFAGFNSSSSSSTSPSSSTPSPLPPSPPPSSSTSTSTSSQSSVASKTADGTHSAPPASSKPTVKARDESSAAPPQAPAKASRLPTAAKPEAEDDLDWLVSDQARAAPKMSDREMRESSKKKGGKGSSGKK